MNILKIFINNCYRIIEKKSILILSFIIIPIMIIASIIVSDNSEAVEHIALVSRDFNYSINNDQLDIHLLAEQPKLYELILGDYDAVVIDDGNRQFNIQTIQSKELKSNLNEYFNHNVKVDFSKDKVKRGIGTNTLGYLVIVILFESILLMSLYPEDRECGSFRRILISNVKTKNYLFAQCLFNFVLLFVPTFLTVVIINKIYLGLNLTVFSLLFIGICIFSVALSLVLTSLIKNLNTCISISGGMYAFLGLFSGCIVPFNNTSKIFDIVTDIIPIKGFLIISQGLENGISISMYVEQIIYIIICTVVLYVAGIIITQKKVNLGLY